MGCGTDWILYLSCCGKISVWDPGPAEGGSKTCCCRSFRLLCFNWGAQTSVFFTPVPLTSLRTQYVQSYFILSTGRVKVVRCLKRTAEHCPTFMQANIFFQLCLLTYYFELSRKYSGSVKVQFGHFSISLSSWISTCINSMCGRLGQAAVGPSPAANVSTWGQTVSCSCIIHCRIKVS